MILLAAKSAYEVWARHMCRNGLLAWQVWDELPENTRNAWIEAATEAQRMVLQEMSA